MAQGGIKWIFNPPAMSPYGGIWENIIHMVKKVLNIVLRQQCLDDEGFHMVLCEAEAILNDHPITKLSDDPNDLELLTLNHILLMKGKPLLPPGHFLEKGFVYKKKMETKSVFSYLFWKRWTQEYLPLLQERQKLNIKKNKFLTWRCCCCN